MMGCLLQYLPVQLSLGGVGVVPVGGELEEQQLPGWEGGQVAEQEVKDEKCWWRKAVVTSPHCFDPHEMIRAQGTARRKSAC